MKSITDAAAFLLLTALLVGGTPFHAYADGAMVGRDPTYAPGGAKGVSHGGTGGAHGGTCSGAIQRCQKAFPASAAACASAGGTCKQTGTFTNPKGQNFPGLAKM
jgi:hypothetical protein